MKRDNLIEVFKTNNPDKKLYADQKQINENASLVKWDQREAWLKKQAGKGKAAKGESKPAASAVEDDSKADDTDDAETEPETPPRTKADLYALLDERGIPYTKRMNIAQLEELLK